MASLGKIGKYVFGLMMAIGMLVGVSGSAAAAKWQPKARWQQGSNARWESRWWSGRNARWGARSWSKWEGGGRWQSQGKRW
jgi:hypothetical protein